MFPQVGQDALPSLRSDPTPADWWIRMEKDARPNTPVAGLILKNNPGYRRSEMPS